MSTVTSNYEFNVQDINGSVKRTSALLRAANAIRVTFHDLQEVARSPSIANIFWSIVQISRVYNSLKRINRLLNASTNDSLGLMGFLKQVGYVEPKDVPVLPGGGNPFGFMGLRVGVSAYRENLQMGMDKIDISNLPEETRGLIQRVLEEDASMTVFNARELLMERMLHPEISAAHGGMHLENTIYARPTSDGVLITAEAPYAWWVEEGQRSFSGHHFMRDATEMSRERLPMRIKEELDRFIRESTT